MSIVYMTKHITQDDKFSTGNIFPNFKVLFLFSPPPPLPPPSSVSSVLLFEVFHV